MKQLVIVFLFNLAGYIAFSQNRVVHDPTYSVNNYKHPNKAAYARKYNLDKNTKLETIKTNRNDNYKQPYNQRVVSNSPAVKSTEPKAGSYKHPYGL